MAAPSEAFVKQYEATITLLTQQLESKLRGTVMVDTNFKGSEKYYDQYNTDDMTEISSRYADTPVGSPDHRRRRITPRYFVSNTLEDPADALQMLADPKSAYMQAKQAAANRKIDDLIITALGGTAYAGAAGGTSTTLVSFDSGNNVIASSSAGMSKTKLLQAKKRLDKSDVDMDERFMVIGPDQMEDLLNTTEVTSSDFNAVKALVEGTLNTFVGFTFKQSTRLTTNDSSERLCYAYQRKGIQMAIQKDVESRLSERPDKNYAWQVYLRMVMGATRLEEARVVQIACTE